MALLPCELSVTGQVPRFRTLLSVHLLGITEEVAGVVSVPNNGVAVLLLVSLEQVLLLEILKAVVVALHEDFPLFFAVLHTLVDLGGLLLLEGIELGGLALLQLLNQKADLSLDFLLVHFALTDVRGVGTALLSPCALEHLLLRHFSLNLANAQVLS